jgi:hypothetical protein
MQSDRHARVPDGTGGARTERRVTSRYRAGRVVRRRISMPSPTSGSPATLGSRSNVWKNAGFPVSDMAIDKLAGPHVYTYRALLRTIAATAGKRPFLFPFPFRLWNVIGYLAEIRRARTLTRNQVELMEKDNLPNSDAPGFEALRISPGAIEDILPQLMQRSKEAAVP